MSHTNREKAKLLIRVRRILAQLEVLWQKLEADVDRASILNPIADLRGGIDGLMGDVIEDHVRPSFGKISYRRPSPFSKRRPARRNFLCQSDAHAVRLCPPNPFRAPSSGRSESQ